MEALRYTLLITALTLACDDPVPEHGLELVYRLAPDQTPARADLDETRAVLTRRLEALEIPGISVRPAGEPDRIAVRIPGGLRAGQVKEACGRRGRLLFAPVDDAGTAFLREQTQDPGANGRPSGGPATGLPPGVEIQEERLPEGARSCYIQSSSSEALQQAIEAVAGRVPAGRELLPAEGRGPGGRKQWRTYLVRKQAWPAGEHIDEAEVVEDPVTGQPRVQIEFDRQGQQDFADLTAGLIGKRLAIVLDGRVQTAPIVHDRIPGGRAVISLGLATEPATRRRKARALAATLGTGALPAPLELLEENGYHAPGR